MTYQIAFFLHLLGLALFLIGHGTSIFFSFAMPRERSPERLRAMLDLSLSSVPLNYLGLVLLLGGGIWLGFIGQFWSQGWIWVSLLLLVGTAGFMMFMGVTYFSKVREAVGLQPYRRSDQVTLGQVASPEALEALLSSPKSHLTGLIGGVALLLILWLMIFKPF